MCGILIIYDNNKKFSSKNFLKLLAHQHHRGPDENWSIKQKGLYLGFTRLSIFKSNRKLSTINHPNEKILVLMNGEIWNYEQLLKKEGLQSYNTEFELIRHLYLKYGSQFIKLLDGIFFICIWDSTKKKMLLYRDPLGKKPAFYYTDNKRFIISSDSKTISRYYGYSCKINTRYMINKYLFNYSDYDDNLFFGVKQIAPSSFLEIQFCQNSSYKIKKHTYTPNINTEIINKDLINTQLSQLIKSISKRYKHTDFKQIGLMLSGGLDSSLLALLLKKLGATNIICFYLGNTSNEDYHWAKTIIEKTGFTFHHIPLSALEIVQNLPNYCYLLSGELVFNIAHIAQYAKQRYPDMKVMLCGEGSDELYSGYNDHKDTHHFFSRIKKGISETNTDTPLIKKFRRLSKDKKSSNAARQKILNFYQEEQLANNHLIPFDYGCMAYSIELRAPFLDLENVNLANKIPLTKKIKGQNQKIILKTILKKLNYIQDKKFYDRKKITFPQALSPIYAQLEQYSQALIPTKWLKTHPLKRLFKGHFNMLWFDLTYYIFVQKKGKTPKHFTMQSLYKNFCFDKNKLI